MVVGHHEGGKIELKLENDGIILKNRKIIGEKFVEYEDITCI